MDKETLKKVSPQAPIMKDRLTKEDKDLVGGAFKDEWITLTVIRDLFFGFDLTEWEKSIIRGLAPSLKKVLAKIFYPVLSKENPIGSSVNSDLWSSVHIMEISPDHQVQNIQGRAGLLLKLKQALSLLDNPDGEKIDLTIKEEMTVQEFIARNTFINYVEQQLVLLNAMAYSIDETPEEVKERMKKDSSK